MGQTEERFSNQERAAGYDQRIRKIVPGYEMLHQMVNVILSSELGPDASVLVVGAGTGHELELLAKAHSGWRFTAIDPSPAMRAIAQEKLQRAGVSDRITWHEGTLDDFESEEAFDAATMIMVLHLVSAEDQYALILNLTDRLKRGSPLVMADIFGDPGTTRYKRMNALTKAWAIQAGLEPKDIEDVFPSVLREDFFAFTEERMKGWLKEAGFIDVQRFYQAFRVGAWITRTNR